MNVKMKPGDIVDFKRIDFNCDVIVPHRKRNKKTCIYLKSYGPCYLAVLGGYRGILSARDYCYIYPKDKNEVWLKYYHNYDVEGENLDGYFIYEKSYKKGQKTRFVLRFVLGRDLSLDSAAL